MPCNQQGSTCSAALAATRCADAHTPQRLCDIRCVKVILACELLISDSIALQYRCRVGVNTEFELQVSLKSDHCTSLIRSSPISDWLTFERYELIYSTMVYRAACSVRLVAAAC
jgi:hypothetical protein